MSRGRSDGSQKKHLVVSVCAVAIFLCFLYVFYGSSSTGTSALEYGSKSLKRLGSSYLSADDDAMGKQDDSSSSFGLGDLDVDIVPKSFPVSSDAMFIIWHQSYNFSGIIHIFFLIFNT